MKPFSSLKYPTGLRLVLGCALLTGLSSALAHADTVTLSNTSSITIPQRGAGSVYPATINVPGVLGPVTEAQITLNGFNHTFLSDVHILLVAPSGQSVEVMGGNCGTFDATDATVTFSDSAAQPLPDSNFDLTGTSSWQPNRVNTAVYPGPAPAGPYGTTMADLNGAAANGNWQLFVYDSVIGESGSITGGWTLNLTTDPAPIVSYQDPTPNQKILLTEFGAGNIAGLANDDFSISSVKVRLSRKRNNVNEFWNGTDWVSNSLTFVDADLTPTTIPLDEPSTQGVRSSSVTWSLDTNVPPQSKLDAGVYGVRVYALDNAGTKSANIDRFFTLYNDITAPTVAIDTPTSNQVVDINNVNGNTFSGTATDNASVTSVKLKLGRKRNGVWEYWNGTDFTPATATFDAAVDTVGDTSVTWQLAVAIPASKLDRGGYALYATAYDAAGNKTTSPSRLFAINGKVNSPSSAADAPSATSAGHS